MQRRKFSVAILAILLIGIAVPTMIPKGHADDAQETLTTSGYVLRNVSDNYYGTTVDAITQGSTLTFTLYFQASNIGNFQRNITMGVKFDYMTTYQNTSSTPVAMGQSAYITLGYTIPSTPTTLNQVAHRWTVEVWGLSAGGTWTSPFCGSYYYSYEIGNTSCRQFTTDTTPEYNSVAFYTSAQSNAMITGQQAQAEIFALQAILGTTKQLPPGSSTAVADLAAAEVQLALAQQAYTQGQFSTAQTDNQNALNQANAAQASLATTGGGTDNATMTSIWLGAVAVLLGGLGAVLVGLGGFNFLRKKAKTLGGNTSPAPSYMPPAPKV